MPSLLAIYCSPLEQVLQQWNEAASDLGFEVLEPIVAGCGSWDYLRLNGEEIFVSISSRSIKLPDDSVWVDLWGISFDQCTDLFPKVLELPLGATEVIVVFDKDLETCFATYETCELSPEQLIEGYESSYLTDALHSLRAFHRDLLGDPERWRAEANERGLGWKEVGDYGVLNVHWEERGQRPPALDPLTGIPTENAIFKHLPVDLYPPHSGGDPLPEIAPGGTSEAAQK